MFSSVKQRNDTPGWKNGGKRQLKSFLQEGYSPDSSLANDDKLNEFKGFCSCRDNGIFRLSAIKCHTVKKGRSLWFPNYLKRKKTFVLHRTYNKTAKHASTKSNPGVVIMCFIVHRKYNGEKAKLREVMEELFRTIGFD